MPVMRLFGLWGILTLGAYVFVVRWLGIDFPLQVTLGDVIAAFLAGLVLLGGIGAWIHRKWQAARLFRMRFVLPKRDGEQEAGNLGITQDGRQDRSFKVLTRRANHFENRNRSRPPAGSSLIAGE